MSKMTEKRTAEVRVFMSQDEHAELAAWAGEECRTQGAQVLHIVRQALARRADEVSPLSDPAARRLTHAARRSLQGSKAHQ